MAQTRTLACGLSTAVSELLRAAGFPGSWSGSAIRRRFFGEEFDRTEYLQRIVGQVALSTILQITDVTITA